MKPETTAQPSRFLLRHLELPVRGLLSISASLALSALVGCSTHQLSDDDEPETGGISTGGSVEGPSSATGAFAPGDSFTLEDRGSAAGRRSAGAPGAEGYAEVYEVEEEMAMEAMPTMAATGFGGAGAPEPAAMARSSRRASAPGRSRAVRAEAAPAALDDAPMPIVGPGRGDGPTPAAGTLTAAAWSDLNNWDFWSDLMTAGQSDWAQYRSSWGISATHRLTLHVAQQGGSPAGDLVVEVACNDVRALARTDMRGNAYLFPQADDFCAGEQEVRVTVEDETHTLSLAELESEDGATLRLDERIEVDSVADVYFLVDTTGSMSDELNFLQTELENVISRTSQISGATIRNGVAFYRDSGDEYKLRGFPLEEDTDTTLERLRAQRADGGGDYPEALAAGLQTTLNEVEWTENSRARLLFVILDAPPHSGEAYNTMLQDAVEKAQEEGVRIIPISASGIDKPTEFLLRHMAIMTGGTYTFITDHSGVGNSHLEVESTIGPHEVMLLNELLVQTISDYINPEDA